MKSILGASLSLSVGLAFLSFYQSFHLRTATGVFDIANVSPIDDKSLHRQNGNPPLEQLHGYQQHHNSEQFKSASGRNLSTENKRNSNDWFTTSDEQSPSAPLAAFGGTTTLNEALSQQQQQAPTIDIMSVGCHEQKPLQQAQRETFGSHPSVRYFYDVTEDDDTNGSCVTRMSNNRVWKVAKACSRPKPSYPVLSKISGHFFSPQTLINKANPVGWLCAQKRPFDGFQRMIEKYQYSNRNITSLPDYFFVVDDDTWMNMHRILDFVPKEYPPNEAHVVAGCLMQTKAEVFNFTVAYGGYGMFFTKRAMQRWLEPLHCPALANSATKSKSSPPQPPLPASHNKQYLDDDMQYFMELACWRLQQNGIGELPLFQNGMSIAHLMYKYVIDQPFERAKYWNEAGFCMHSDWAWSYFVNYYHIAQLPNQSHYYQPDQSAAYDFDKNSILLETSTTTQEEQHSEKHVLFDRMIGYNNSVVHPWSPHEDGDMSNLQQCNNGIDLGPPHPNSKSRKHKSGKNGNKYCDSTAHFCHRITPSHMHRLHQQQQKQQKETTQPQ